ncbi:hypothetical protein B0J13DRAFT_292383 [Dactylonectria estremocensis]|uniref:Uncharacterized protein n=1 Tax=Dactylonectria estremocensis TaxID=1079267 RepID=A0A9P9I768_9HYPO|nr:hypothetical protein B0J13DRAFT_292383 [Dactylonectria estremocensis]
MASQGVQGQVAESVTNPHVDSPQLPALTVANLLQLMGSIDGGLKATTTIIESSYDSINIDQLSISDSSRHAEPLNVNDPQYPIIGHIVSRLLDSNGTLQQNSMPARESGQKFIPSTSVPTYETTKRGRNLVEIHNVSLINKEFAIMSNRVVLPGNPMRVSSSRIGPLHG